MIPAWLTVALGTAAALLAWVKLPLAAADPFRGSMSLVPLACAVFYEIGRWAKRRGGRLSPATTRAELATLAFLALAVFYRQHMGIDGLDRGLAVGLLLLLGLHTMRLLIALRPSLGRVLPPVPPWPFFVLPLLVYTLLMPWLTALRPPDGDEPYYLLLTHSLAYDLDADLSNNYSHGDWNEFVERRIEPQFGDPLGSEGEIYSRHGVLLPLFLMPGYRVAGKHGAMFMMAVLTAALVWLTLRLTRHYFPRRPGASLAAVSIMAFTPPLLLYSYQIWPEVAAALLIVLSLDGMLALDKRRNAHWSDWILFAIPLVALPFLKLRYALVTAGLLAVALLRGRSHRRRGLWLVVTVVAASGCGLLLLNRFLFDNPLKYQPVASLLLHKIPLVQFVYGLLGLLYDCAFGIFAASPIWMLLLPGALLLVIRRHVLAIHLPAIFGVYLLFVAPRREWYGAWSPPFRYGLILLPLLTLALIPLLVDRRRIGARAILAGLGVATVLLTLIWLVEPGWTYNLAHGRSHLIDQLSVTTGTDFARFFPSAVRPRIATWLWPPLSLLLFGTLWWLPRQRSGPAAMLGASLVLLALASLAVATRTLPSRTVEFEDRYVGKQGGQLHPERWTRSRSRFRGGWLLEPGGSLTVPVIAGGDQLLVDVDVHPQGKGRPVLLIGTPETILARRRLPAVRRWRTLRFGPFPWRPEDRLVLRLRPDRTSDAPSSVIFDRAKLAWTSSAEISRQSPATDVRTAAPGS